MRVQRVIDLSVPVDAGTVVYPGDPTPVTGGGKVPARLLRTVPDPDVVAPASPLDRHLQRLLTLHKDVAERSARILYRGTGVTSYNDPGALPDRAA